MQKTGSARRVTVREMDGSANTPAERRALERARGLKKREEIIANVGAAVEALAPPARSDGDMVLAVFEAVMRKESRVLVRRDLLDDLVLSLRDMGCDHDMPNDNPKWRRLKAALRALRASVE